MQRRITGTYRIRSNNLPPSHKVPAVPYVTPSGRHAPTCNTSADPPSLGQISQHLARVIDSPILDPHKKGEAIHDYSRQMMQALFRQPSAQFIQETKRTIGQIVDVILSDDET